MADNAGMTAPVVRRVRAYFAPVQRVGGVATVWDAAEIAGFAEGAGPAGWVDLGWCAGFVRKSGTKVAAVVAGAPGVAVGQVRTEVEATVAAEFESWGKLQMALSSGAQQMNVLAKAAGAAANGSGGVAVAAVALGAGSSAVSLGLGGAAAGFAVGDLVVVDVDYAGQAGFVGSGVSGGFVKTPGNVLDVDYVRRVSLNVARVSASDGAALTLAGPLIAGMPGEGMKVSKVVGFCDREGGSFFQEWSGVFVADGEQGDRVVFHYPRLQSWGGSFESKDGLVGVTAKTSMERWRLGGSWRALPVRDANDGEMVVCFRSYVGRV